ncbi:MAG TPA: PQQ-binding-like beta-propeller repeat protein [Xanthomonadales bacterium]|nr:PQQ-binding-like beta-propeller repeat protein [Xanthomonadales bacterium]
MTVRGRFALAGMGAALAVSALLFSGAASRPSDPGAYTRAQAASGQLVYVQHCLKCHGANLEGGAGAVLMGPRFGASLAKGKMSAPALFQFVSGAMPLDAPGTLTEQQYLDVLAFILEKNAYAPGSSPLTKATLARQPLLPYPNLAPDPVASAAPESYASPSVPAAARVALDDASLQSAERDDKDWRLPGRTYGNWRYSPLKQIDAGNVAHLELVKLVHTGMFDSFETTPIVADGVMYVTTPVVDRHMKIMAIDAATGDTLWSTTYALGTFKICCGPNNRGAALAYGNLYVTTLDDKLVAFDARTGTEKWETRVADPSVGYSESMAPQVFEGTVVVGSAGGEWAVRGFVAGYDARTGKQRWRWYATDPKTFSGDSWKTGGGTVWTTPAIDAAQHLVIFGTGNPNPDLEGSTRKGDNLYTDSIVALDVRTGKLRWYYQEVKHDLWDYDATSNVVLFDVHQNGQTIPAAGEAGKVGWFFIVDRRNGKLLRKSQPFVAQNKNMFGKRSVLPGANGGSEWSPPAYSPLARRVYVLGIDQLMDFKTHPDADHPGYMRTGSVFTNTQKPKKIQTGTFSAIDVDTGKIAWQYKAPKPMIGGALATAGGLVFVGEGDGTFEAFDAENGRKLWTYAFVGGANAPAVSYEVAGTQYVAVAAGGNFQLDFNRADEIGIFKLKR